LGEFFRGKAGFERRQANTPKANEPRAQGLLWVGGDLPTTSATTKDSASHPPVVLRLLRSARNDGKMFASDLRQLKL